MNVQQHASTRGVMHGYQLQASNNLSCTPINLREKQKISGFNQGVCSGQKPDTGSSVNQGSVSNKNSDQKNKLNSATNGPQSSKALQQNSAKKTRGKMIENRIPIYHDISGNARHENHKINKAI
jgi:hypothetical protein